ncbi:MAG TPA: WD40 repeat domain-containing protein [Ktedonobacteraceae bacterium]|nr:WD40 repeat domain-containing protein [Ktedonobacteraceae bacterium]
MNQDSPSQQQTHPQQLDGQATSDCQPTHAPLTPPTFPLPQSQQKLSQTNWLPTSPPNTALSDRESRFFSSYKLTAKKFVIFISILIIVFATLGGIFYIYVNATNSSHQKNVARQPSVPPTGTKITTLTRFNGATLAAYLSWSKDGTQLFAVTMNGDLQTFNTITWNSMLNYTIPYNIITSAAWSPNQMYLATVSLMDSDQNAIRVWDVATGNESLVYYSDSDVTSSIAWSPDSTRIASGGDQTVDIWDANTGNALFTFPIESEALAWSPDGKYLASANSDTVSILDTSTGSTLLTFHHQMSDVWRLSWSPNSKYIALAGSTGSSIQIWDTTNGHQILTYHGHSGPVFCVAWSPDGTRIASGGEDKTVQIWDATTGKLVFTYHGHTEKVGQLAWSPDGRFIASSDYDGTLQVWWAI